MNVLAVAPHEGLLPLMKEVIPEFPELDVTFVEGNLEDALVSALSVFHRDFDVVISRGGTAQVLEDKFSVPIVDIELSASDIIYALKTQGLRCGRVAAVGFRNMLTGVACADRIYDGSIEAFPIEFADELDLVLDEVEEGGYDIVLGDKATCDAARKIGLAATFLSSGIESVRRAFKTASLLTQSDSKSNETTRLLRDLIRNQGIRIAVFNEAAELAYTTLAAEDSPLLDELASYAQAGRPPERFLFRHEGAIFTVRSLVRTEEGQRLTAFTITSENAGGKDRFAGIEYFSSREVDESYRNSTFNIIDAGTSLEPVLRRAGTSPRPILLEGETGCGKPRVAQLLYLVSPYFGQPYIEIDCDLLDDKSWEFLTTSYRSPLYEAGSVINFRSLHMLPAARWRVLLGTIQRTALAQRSKLLFSLNTENDEPEPEVAHRFTEQLGCFTIQIPPLRQAHISEAAPERYLAALARRDGLDFPPRLTPEAATIVGSYHWPRNILQFKQVMNWSYAAAENGMISSDMVREALNRDATARFSASFTPGTSSMLDILKPLSQTNAEICRMVVQNYGGNKTAAAKTLGISRTTLWNILKNLKET